MTLTTVGDLETFTCCPDDTFLEGDGCLLLSRQSDVVALRWTARGKVPLLTLKQVLWASGGPQHTPFPPGMESTWWGGKTLERQFFQESTLLSHIELLLLLLWILILALLLARKRKPETWQPKLRGRVVPGWKTCSCPAPTCQISPHWLPPAPSYHPSYLRDSWFVRSDLLGTWTMIPPERWITEVWRCKHLGGNLWLLATLCHVPHWVSQEPSHRRAALSGTVGSQLTLWAEEFSLPFSKRKTRLGKEKLCSFGDCSRMLVYMKQLHCDTTLQSQLLCVASSEKRKELLPTSRLRFGPALLRELPTLFI